MFIELLENKYKGYISIDIFREEIKWRVSENKTLKENKIHKRY